MRKGENNKVVSPSVDGTCIYEGGELGQISLPELIGNEVAIKQLINQHNIKERLANNLQEKVNKLEEELSFQKTSPFYAIVSCVINIVGTILIGLGTSLLEKNTSSAPLILVLGGLAIAVANIQTICHRWVYRWFNRKK